MINNTFAILAHRVNDCLRFTVGYLSAQKNSTILIHVDKKSDVNDFRFLETDNVMIIDERYAIQWGHISMVYATLALLKKCPSNNYFSLLSGDDFPCSNYNYFLNVISSLGDSSLLHIQDHRNNFVDPLKRFEICYPSIFFRKKRCFFIKFLCYLYKIKPLKKNRSGIEFINENHITLYKGTQWFTLSPKAVLKILTYLNQKPQYLDTFTKSFCPDEIFFQTLIKYLDLPIRENKKNINNCLRYIDWSSGPEYPKLLNQNDFYILKKSQCLFARKASDNLSISDFENLVSS